jgi:ribosomal protein S18 acetylase RimI-like enzyme
MYRIVSLTAREGEPYLGALTELLRDAVESGASVGFVRPLEASRALAYWEEALSAVSSGERVLLVALEGDGLLGSVQLGLVAWPSQRHRAEVMKLLVSSAARRRGIGSALMRALEAEARGRGRTLLVLDTVRGDDAERLYTKLGYETAGVVPRYAVSPSGASLDDVVYMFRELTLGAGAQDYASKRQTT